MRGWTDEQAGAVYAPEVRERAERMVFEHGGEDSSQWVAIGAVAPTIGCKADALRLWMRRAKGDPAQGQRIFFPGGARLPLQAMKALIDAHRQGYGIEPICKVLPIAPSTYYAHAGRRKHPEFLGRFSGVRSQLIPRRFRQADVPCAQTITALGRMFSKAFLWGRYAR